MPSQLNEALLRGLTPSVLGVLVRRGADFAAAEDAVQDALVEALRDPAIGLQTRQASPVVPSARADVVKIAVSAPLAALSAVFEGKTAILL